MITLKDIEKAIERLEGKIYKTPVIRMECLDEILGCQVYLKPECIQKTNSFKIRGALNKMLSLQQEELQKGVVTCSSGNHGKAVAYAAKLLGVKATVILPYTAPDVKVRGVEKLGAEIVKCDITQRFVVAEELKNKYGYTFIPPFDDWDIIAGQGTIGIEILEQVEDIDTIVTPLGGGGLISGIAVAVKSKKPNIEIIGVEATLIPKYTKSLEVGRIVEVESKISMADALLLNIPGQRNFPIIQKYIDKVVTVSEEFIANGNQLLVNEGKMVVEPTSAVVVAAILEGKIKFNKHQKVCFVLTSGNTELSILMNLQK